MREKGIGAASTYGASLTVHRAAPSLNRRERQDEGARGARVAPVRCCDVPRGSVRFFVG